MYTIQCIYIYIIADVIVYCKERKIEKKKERKYIAVKKKEKKKKTVRYVPRL